MPAKLALRADRGRWHLVVAIMAKRDLLRAMMRQGDVAMRALHHVAAGRTLDVRRKSAPIQQQNHLPARFQRFGDGRVQLPADRAARHCPPGFVDPQIDRAHRRQRPIQHAARHLDQRILARLRPVPAFQRRRGRAEHQRHRFGLRPGQGHVAGVIPRGASPA